MADRCEKGLCFNCHQKYSRSHRCPARFLLLIADVDDTTAEANPTFHEWVLDAGIVPQPVDNSENQAQISLHALSGTRASETLRLRGYIATHPICVLVDGGSTHNFIQKQVAHALGLANLLPHLSKFWSIVVKSYIQRWIYLFRGIPSTCICMSLIWEVQMWFLGPNG